MRELYKNIKRLREEKGLSQDALAKLTGYTDRSSITKIEKGQVDLQQSKIELFAKALGTSSSELVGWDNDSIYNSTHGVTVSVLGRVAAGILWRLLRKSSILRRSRRTFPGLGNSLASASKVIAWSLISTMGIPSLSVSRKMLKMTRL